MTQLQSLATVLIRLWAIILLAQYAIFGLDSMFRAVIAIAEQGPFFSWSGTVSSIAVPFAVLVVGIVMLTASPKIAAWLCRDVSAEPLFEGINARALAIIGTGLLGLYLFCVSIPAAVRTIVFELYSRNSSSGEMPLSNPMAWQDLLPVAIGLALFLSAVPIGRLLSDYRKLGLIDGEAADSASNSPRQNSEQS